MGGTHSLMIKRKCDKFIQVSPSILAIFNKQWILIDINLRTIICMRSCNINETFYINEDRKFIEPESDLQTIPYYYGKHELPTNNSYFKLISGYVCKLYPVNKIIELHEMKKPLFATYMLLSSKLIFDVCNYIILNIVSLKCNDILSYHTIIR